MIRITYVQDGRTKRATIEGSTTQDAVRWMMQNVPDVRTFVTSIMRRARVPQRPTPTRRDHGRWIAADETGIGAHRAVRS